MTVRSLQTLHHLFTRDDGRLETTEAERLLDASGDHGAVADDERNALRSIASSPRTTSAARNVIETFLAWRSDGWPKDYLPFCYHGCTVYSVIDLNTARVGIVDTDAYESGADPSEFLAWQKDSLTDWLEAWLAGENLFFAVDDE